MAEAGVEPEGPEAWSHLTYTYGAHEVRSLRSAHVLLLAGVGSGVGVDGVDDDEDEEARFRLLRLQRSLARCLGACGVGALSASAPMEAEELEHMAKEVSAPYRKRPRREGVYPDFSTGGGGGGTASSPVKDAAESSTLFVPSSQSLNKEFISKFSCVVYIRPIYKRALELNSVCRSCSVPFLWACQTGPLLSVFCDPGADSPSNNPRGFCRRDSRVVRVGHVTRPDAAAPQLVTCDVPHGLRSGDLVSVGASAAAPYLVEPVSEREVQVLPAAGAGPGAGAAAGVSGADCVPNGKAVGEGEVEEEQEGKQRGIRAGDVISLIRRAEPERKYVNLRTSKWGPSFESALGGSAASRARGELLRHVAFLSKAGVEQTVGEMAAKLGLTDPDKQAIYEVERRMFDMEEGRSSSSSCEHQASAAAGVFSGVVSSQVLDLVTRRFPPLCQWFYYELPSSSSADESAKKKKWSGAAATTSGKPTVMLTGGGALGVGLFERLVEGGAVGRVLLAGFDGTVESCGGGGAGEEEDGGILLNTGLGVLGQGGGKEPLWKKLVDFASARDPDLSVEHLPSPDSGEEVDRARFHARLFASVDALASAGGGWDARRVVGALSEKFVRPMVDVGADGMVGHVQSVLPHVTDSYLSSHDRDHDTTDDEAPFCVVKSLPFRDCHAVDWARDKVDRLTRAKPEKFNAFWAQQEREELAKDIEGGSLPEHSFLVMRLLSENGGAACPTWQACLAFARNKFEKYFAHKARQLLVNFPVEGDGEEAGAGGKRFWTYPKRPPAPIDFDPRDELHLGFVASLAVAWAHIVGVEVSAESLRSERLRGDLSRVSVTPFVARADKKVVTDESVTRRDAEEEAGQGRQRDVDPAGLAGLVRKATRTSLRPGAVSSSLRGDLVSLSARLRCLSYGIPAPDAPTVRKIALRLCPCPVPAVEVLSDLAYGELLNVLDSSARHHRRRPHDWWVSLSPGVALVRSESRRAVPFPGCGHLKVEGPLTLWDRMEVRGGEDWTLQRLLDELKDKFGAVATLIVQGTKMVYVQALPTHAKRKDKLMTGLVRREPESDFALLSVTVAAEETDAEEDVSIPQVKYFTSSTSP